MNMCEKCSKQLSDKVKDYSVEKLGRPLCFDCQQSVKDNLSKNISWDHVDKPKQKYISPVSPNKDISIIRMSCLKSAVELVSQLNSPKEPATLSLNLAEKFEKWVRR